MNHKGLIREDSAITMLNRKSKKFFKIKGLDTTKSEEKDSMPKTKLKEFNLALNLLRKKKKDQLELPNKFKMKQSFSRNMNISKRQNYDALREITFKQMKKKQLK